MASIKCPSCGLINFADATNCRRCKAELQTVAVPAATPDAVSGRVVVGPVFTSGGFKSWHLVCLPDVLVAVPQGALDGILTGSVPTSGMMGLLGMVMAAKGKKAAQTAVDAIQQMTEGTLRSDPRHVLCSLSELRSISFKRPTFSNPEIRIDSLVRGLTVYGVTNIGAFPEFSKLLQGAYPSICAKGV
jgi:hypothetical protein